MSVDGGLRSSSTRTGIIAKEERGGGVRRKELANEKAQREDDLKKSLAYHPHPLVSTPSDSLVHLFWLSLS